MMIALFEGEGAICAEAPGQTQRHDRPSFSPPPRRSSVKPLGPARFALLTVARMRRHFSEYRNVGGGRGEGIGPKNVEHCVYVAPTSSADVASMSSHSRAAARPVIQPASEIISAPDGRRGREKFLRQAHGHKPMFIGHRHCTWGILGRDCCGIRTRARRVRAHGSLRGKSEKLCRPQHWPHSKSALAL
jgi:hypothetical protein